MDKVARYELANLAIDRPVPVAEAIAYCRDRFIGVDQYTSATSYGRREKDVYLALEMIAYTHLEVPDAPDAETSITEGFDCALHLFLEDWQTNPDPYDPHTEPYNLVIAARRRDKEVGWYRALSRGLILGLLSGRHDDVARLCSWPWADLAPDYSGMGDDLENEVALMYLVVSAGLRTEPMEGLDRIVAKIRRCRIKRPRLLMKLWETVEQSDQAAFEDALIRSLEHFAASPRLDRADARIAERLALPQSAIALVAGWRGLQLPDLPDELAVFLINRRSLGLDA